MRMKGKYGKEDARLSFCSELWHGTFEIHSREGSEHWFNRFGVVGDVNWRMSGLPGFAAAAGVSA